MKMIRFLFFLILAIPAYANQVERFTVIKVYHREDWESKIDSLRALFGKNKTMPEEPEYELPILVALSHYPELKDVYIRFVVKPAYIPLTSQPFIPTIFLGKRREYLITISSKSTFYMENILLRNVSFNAQIGVIGHELAHTLFYLGKDAWQLASVGLDYFTPSLRAKFEKDTDRRAIRHGLGWQLYEYSAFIRHLPDMEPHNDWVDRFYLNPEGILEYMAQFPEYAIGKSNG